VRNIEGFEKMLLANYLISIKQHLRENKALSLDTPKSQKGFGLVEIMVALVVLVLAVLALQSSIISSQVLNRMNFETNMALAEATRRIETAKSTAYANLAAGTTNFDVPTSPYIPNASAVVHTLNPIQTGGRVGSVFIGAEQPDKIKNITVAVTWRAANGKAKTVRLSALVTEQY